VWLEVRTCEDGTRTTGVDEQILKVPVVSEVLEAAAEIKGHSGIWDYSRRLYKGEIEILNDALGLAKKAEDTRSISLSISVMYKGSCYSLTLFAIKRSQ